MKTSDLRSGSDWAKPGVKCICVDFSPGIFGPHRVYRTDIFKILEVDRHSFLVPAARLLNERSGGANAWDEWSKLSRYRPLIESDAEMFKELLNTLPADLDPLEEVVDYAGLMLDASYAVGLAAHTRGERKRSERL